MNIAQAVAIDTTNALSHTLAGRSLPSDFNVGTDHNE
jgi:hypothetical protein